jgi:hypothetical protein
MILLIPKKWGCKGKDYFFNSANFRVENFGIYMIYRLKSDVYNLMFLLLYIKFLLFRICLYQ